MNRVLWAVFAGILGANVIAQGTIRLNNRTPEGDVPIYGPGPGGMVGLGASPGGATAQLFLLPSDGGALAPLLPSTSFRTTGELSPFVYAVDVSVPDMPAGSRATVILRAWGNNSPDLLWQSLPLVVTLGGTNANGEIFPTPSLNGLQGSMPLTPALSYFQSICRTNEDLHFLVYNAAGFPFTEIVESSTNLVNWQQVAPNWAPEKPGRSFTLTSAGTNSEKLFFRMRLEYRPE
jgi:hypothetical protein